MSRECARTEENNIANKGEDVSELLVTASRDLLTGQLPKQVPKPGTLQGISIRHTMVSKFRMEKSNSLHGSYPVSDPSQTLFSQVAEIPDRRYTFHPDMQRTKQKLDLRSTGPFYERRPFTKKIGVSIQRRFERGICKENKPSLTDIHQEINDSEVERDEIMSMASPIHTEDQMLPPYFQTRNILSPIQKSMILPVQNQSLGTSRKLPISASSHKDNKFGPETNTCLKQKTENGNKARILESRTLIKNTTIGSHSYTLQSKTQEGCNTSAENSKKQNIKAKETAMLKKTETRPHLAVGLPNYIHKSLVLDSRLNNCTSVTPKITNTSNSLNQQRKEEWLEKRGKTARYNRHLCCFDLSKKHFAPPRKVDKSSKGSALKSIDSVIVSHSLENSNTYIENCTLQEETVPSEKTQENVISEIQSEAQNYSRNLIHLSYPHVEREQWLNFLNSRPAVKELARYWEFMAALEKARVDFGSSVSYNERPTLEGVDAQNIQQRLDELWKKFHTLSVLFSEKASGEKPESDEKFCKSRVVTFANTQKYENESSVGGDLQPNIGNS